VESHLQLQGWSQSRRLIVLRRKLRERAAPPEPDSGQLRLPGWVLDYKGGDWYEHAVLVTSWEEKELPAVAQAYRDRADTENMLSLSSLHAKARKIANLLASMSAWLRAFRDSAEQLAKQARWPALLRRIFRHFRAAPTPITPPPGLLAAPNCRI